MHFFLYDGGGGLPWVEFLHDKLCFVNIMAILILFDWD